MCIEIYIADPGWVAWILLEISRLVIYVRLVILLENKAKHVKVEIHEAFQCLNEGFFYKALGSL